MTRRRLLVGMTASAAAAFALACGGGDDSKGSGGVATPAGGASTRIQRPSGSPDDETATWQAIDKAYEAALAAGEKRVMFYEGAANAEAAKKNFDKRFPGVTFEFKDPTSNPSGFILQEMQAGQKTGDVLGGTIQYFAGLARANQVDTTFDWKSMGIDPDRISPIGTVVTAEWVVGPVYIYNNQVVKKEDVPATMEGWFNPKFKGKMTTTPVKYFSGIGWYGVAYGEEAAIALAKRFVDEGYLTISDNAYTLLLSGEKPVVPFDATWQQVVFERQGAPTTLKVYNPGLGIPRWQAGVIKGTSVPNLAKMVVLWLSTLEGVKGYWDNNAWDIVNRKGNYVSDLLKKDNVNIADLPREDAKYWEIRTDIAAKARRAVLGQ